MATDSCYQRESWAAHDEKIVLKAGHGRAAGCQNEPLIGSYTLFKRAAGIAGLTLGFVVGCIAIVGGVFLALQGQQIVGTVFGGLYLVGMVSVFVYGSQQRRKEREARQRQERT